VTSDVDVEPRSWSVEADPAVTSEALASEDAVVSHGGAAEVGDGEATEVDDGDSGVGLPLATELARVTGLLLVVLLPIHLVTVLLADPTEVDVLLERWENRAWLLADWGFLTVGLAHCLLSLRARVVALGPGPAPAVACPHCGGDLPGTDDGFGLLAFRCLVTLSVGLFLAASWAMLRLV
jgi:hypothetical protein